MGSDGSRKLTAYAALMKPVVDSHDNSSEEVEAIRDQSGLYQRIGYGEREVGVGRKMGRRKAVRYFYT